MHVILCVALGAVLSAHAYTKDETNTVLRTLGIMIEGQRGSDCLDEDGWRDPPPEPYQRYEDLFACYPTNEVGGTWTAQERQEAFESFLWRLPELSPDDVDREVLFYADSLLEFCEWYNKTNFLPHAKRILLSSYADKLPTARMMFEKFARPSEETYRFVECVMTNQVTPVMSVKQEYFLMSFGEVLLKHWRETDLTTITNGVRLFHHVTDDCRARNLFDFLMREIDSNYAISSNRLAFATTALNAPVIPGRFEPYGVQSFFIPITNTLLNASGPLKVLDLSWLDEPTTNNTNETEQQEENNE